MKPLIYISFILSIFLLTSCSPLPPEKQCSVDADCVPVACCHATGAVNYEYGPSCEGVLCTLECQPETLDCGQGKVQCLQKQCVVVWE